MWCLHRLEKLNPVKSLSASVLSHPAVINSNAICNRPKTGSKALWQQTLTTTKAIRLSGFRLPSCVCVCVCKSRMFLLCCCPDPESIVTAALAGEEAMTRKAHTKDLKTSHAWRPANSRYSSYTKHSEIYFWNCGPFKICNTKIQYYHVTFVWRHALQYHIGCFLCKPFQRKKNSWRN